MPKDKTKREQVNDLIGKMDTDQTTPTADKLLYVAKIQTKLLADMVDVQVEVLVTLEAIRLQTG